MNKFSVLKSAFLLLIFITFFDSCGKKWKQTTNVDFQFYISQGEPSELLHFTSGNMIIREIDFAGDRKKGGEVNFSNSISNGAILNFNGGSSSPPIHYDIPQGTYNKINLTLKAFDEDPSPSISLNGYYLNDDSDTIRLIYEFNSGVNFYATGKTSSGKDQIVLVENRPATCQITFDLNYWFDTVTENLLEDADISLVNSVPTLVINENENEIIYNLISSRIPEATKVVFQ